MYGGGKVDWREEGKVGKGEDGAFLKTEGELALMETSA